jgi:hypothetical protein
MMRARGTNMRCTAIRSAILFAAVLSVAACRKDYEPEASIVPPDYSPHYTKVGVLKPDGREKKVLVPEACMTPDDQSVADLGPERLPPGCANAYNLQRMAARKRDLTQGRPIGAAPAAPAARAAQRYIDGREQPVLGGGVDPEEENGPQGSAPAAR